jgi:hypothetical protein
MPLTFRITAPGAVTKPGHVSTTAPGITEDILASQEPRTTTRTSHISVRGTTTPGAVVDVALGRPATPANATSVVQARAGADGAFHITLPIPRGQAIVTVTAIAGSHTSGWAQQTVTRR